MKVTIRPNDDKVVLTMTIREFRNLTDSLDTASLADQCFKWTLGGTDGKMTEDFTHHRGRTVGQFLVRLADAFGIESTRGGHWWNARGTRDLGVYDPSAGFNDNY